MGIVGDLQGRFDRDMIAKTDPENTTEPRSAATIGIVAIGRNEGARLETCLTSLLGQTKRVVYADSASSDDSVAVARRSGVEVVVLPNDVPLSAAAGRAAGYQRLRAKHPEVELVQFIDGDCLLDPDWLAAAARFLDSHPQAAVVCGRRYEAHPETSVYNAMCDAEWDTPIGEARACGGDALYRSAAYEAAGGFHADLLAGEEPELCGRLRDRGWEIWRIDARMTEHDAKMLGFGQWWRRSRRGGYGYAQVWNATRKSTDPLYGRQLASAVAWVIFLPLAVTIVASLVGSPWVLAAIPIAYAAQTVRIYRKIADGRPQQMVRAGLTLLAKVPETSGALRYLLSAERPVAGSKP